VDYQPIENYGIIGNMRTVALVGINGSIDWYCFPNFDSPSFFGALLDHKKGGYFRIHPVEANVTYKQLYWPGTNILITRFLLSDGIIEIEDFMPVGISEDSPWYHQLYRRVRCVRGSVKLKMECFPAFNYGRHSHEIHLSQHYAKFSGPNSTMALFVNLPLTKDPEVNQVRSEFILSEGESRVFILSKIEPHQENISPPSDSEAESLFQTTVGYWRKWLSACSYRGRWREQVYRSALVLKLLTYESTGAIIASATCSLPEVIGGSRNWDYRYSWLRDAAFTVYGLLRIGFKKEAIGFMNWIRSHSNEFLPPQALPVMFQINGGPCIPERQMNHLEGYRKSHPVRVGNGASFQFQNDIYGELMDSFYLFNKHVSPISYDMWVQLRKRLNWICEHWQLPDDGIWEVRGGRQHFVYSKVMNWVALDRGIRLADKRSFPSDRDYWIKTRDQIYEEVMTRGWNEKRQAFTQYYGSDDLDASLLIMPLVFFIGPNDIRMTKTIDAILKNPDRGGLVSDGLVYRYPPQSKVDGLEGIEGTFNMCSFWLVEALTRAGNINPKKLDQARLFFERMLGYANHLGLYGEQIGFQGEALGNFPQAFTHLSLISAAFNLDRTLGGTP
jgi:GH15 family glucan-1,4-alpha-glucosidase